MSLIKIKNLHKTYVAKGRVITKALRGIHLEIEEGEIITLLGVNGARKTTLSSIISSLHPSTTGDIEGKANPFSKI